MCLLARQIDEIVDKEDVVCYKIVYYDEDRGVYVAPHMGTTIKKECIDGSEPYNALGTPDVFQWGVCIYKIESGFIHTYAKKENAVKALTFLRKREEGRYANHGYYELYECIIPAGTKYYAGYYEDFENAIYNSYASTSITFKEKLCV